MPVIRPIDREMFERYTDVSDSSTNPLWAPALVPVDLIGVNVSREETPDGIKIEVWCLDNGEAQPARKIWEISTPPGVVPPSAKPFILFVPWFPEESR